MKQGSLNFAMSIDDFIARFESLSDDSWGYPLCERVLNERERALLRELFLEKLGSSVIAVHMGWQGWGKLGPTPRDRVLGALYGVRRGVDARDKRRIR